MGFGALCVGYWKFSSDHTQHTLLHKRKQATGTAAEEGRREAKVHVAGTREAASPPHP